MTPDRCGQGSFQCVRSHLPLPLGEVARVSGSERVLPGRLGRGKKEGRKNPPQHIYHITPPSASQRRSGREASKSVACTKTDVCIWETFHLEKFGFP